LSRSRLLSLLCAAAVCLAVFGVSSSSVMGLPSQLIGSRGPALIERESDSQSILDLFPELKSLPAPLWVQEGLRVYYRTSAATVPNPMAKSSREGIAPPIMHPEKLSPAAPAVVRTDVIALDTRFSATSSTLFIGDLMIPWEDVTRTAYAGAGDFWINPVVIKNLARRPPDQLVVSEVRYEADGITYDCTRFDYGPKGSNRHHVWIFQSSTGLLVYQAQWLVLSDESLSYVSAAEFVTKRNMSLPWSGQAAPGWVKPGARMTYQGAIRTWMPTTGPGIPIPAFLEVEMAEAGQNWSIAKVRRVFSGDDGQIGTAKNVHSGAGKIGGFWLPVSGLTRLRNGDKLDPFDPVVGSTVEVSYAGKTQSGISVVAIFEWGAQYKRVWIYRITDGKLIYWLDEKLVDPITRLVQQAEWQLTEE
jgi:hypothetical protein